MFDAVPEAWTRTTLGQIIRLEYGRSLPESLRVNGDVPVYGSNGVVGFHSEPLVREQGIVIGRKGTAGSVNVTDGPFWPIDTTYYVRPLQELDFRWLSAMLNHAQLGNLNEATGVPGLNRDNAYRQQVLLPPLDEQRRIGQVLICAGQCLLATQATLRKLRELRTATVENLVASVVGERQINLSEVTEIMDSGWSPDCENIPADHGQWCVLRTTAVTWSGYDDGENKRLPSHLRPRPSIVVEKGDILITRAGPAERTGVVAIVDSTSGRRMLSDKLIRVRLNQNKANAVTISEILGSRLVQAQINRVKSGMAASQTNITQKLLGNLRIPFPDFATQTSFANAITAMKGNIRELVLEISELRNLQCLLSDDLLSGRVRVPT
jgi:type I restriction enzyme S subunit